ncbi:MAG TPA: hypothetical protein VFR81_10575, partial [Longimicrobium sp.]|nr:hypothetical protein [Longimicrobium sp.]
MLRSVPRALLAGLALVAAACSDRSPAPLPETPSPEPPPPALAALRCRMDVRARQLACAPAGPETAPGVSPLIVGGQGTNVLLASSGTSYDSTTQILRSDVTVKNLMAQALGTTDGAFPAPEGVRVFFHSGPTVTEGTGAVTVANADGEEVFTSGQQKYFQYAGMLATGSTTAPREWRFAVPKTVAFFSFTVYVAAPVAGPDALPAAIVLLGGHGATDTIDANLRTLLRIGVRGADGKPAANTGVVFEAISDGQSWFEVWSAAPVPGAVIGQWTEVMTDSLGIARVRIKLGRKAGPARLVVAVPDLELTDTARYTILPGNLKELRSFPADTTVVFGGRAPLRYATYDRVGNARSGDPLASVTLAVSTGPGSVDGNAVVGGSTLGAVTAVATLGTLRDSSLVRVVPPLSMVASVTPMVTGETHGFYEFTLDGSDVRRLHVAQGGGSFAEVTAEW